MQRKSNTRTMQETTSSLEDDDVFKASSCYILSETLTCYIFLVAIQSEAEFRSKALRPQMG